MMGPESDDNIVDDWPIFFIFYCLSQILWHAFHILLPVSDSVDMPFTFWLACLFSDWLAYVFKYAMLNHVICIKIEYNIVEI